VRRPRYDDQTASFGKLGQGRGQVLNDLAGDDLGRRQVVGVLQRLVTEPGDVEVGLVSRHQLVVGEVLDSLGLDALKNVVLRVRSSSRTRQGAFGEADSA
jgi:hypothetical protein